jgi:hypothetical protein
MNIAVHSLDPGQRSLPAELRTRHGRGTQYFGPMRLKNSLSGVSGFGDCTDTTTYDADGNPIYDTVCTDDTTPPVGTTGPNPPSVQTTNVICGDGSIAYAGEFCPSSAAGTPVPLTAAQTAAITAATSQAGAAPAGYAGPRVVSATAATPAAPSGYQWAQVINATGQTMAKVLAVSQGASVVNLPNGAQMIYQGATGAVAAASTSISGSLGSLMSNPVILIGGAILLWMLMGGSRR